MGERAPAARPRCGWAGADPLYVRYHDEEWGVPSHDDRHLFEMLMLEGAQAGLSWITILRKRENYRRAFDRFDAKKIAKYDARKLKALLGDEGIVRNRLKIESTRDNARAFLEVQKEFGSFDRFIWSFVGGKPIVNRPAAMRGVPARTEALRRDEQGAEEARLPLRRLDHLLRVHAGVRPRRRPRADVFSRAQVRGRGVRAKRASAASRAVRP